MFNIKHILSGVFLVIAAVSVNAETINVTNTNDSGTGSLRAAIIAANANISFTNILINIPGSSGVERVINVPTSYPAFTSPVEVKTDAAQTGPTVLLAPVVSGPGGGVTGLTFDPGSGSSSVSSVTFRRFVFSVVLNASSIVVDHNKFELNQGGIDVRLLNGNAAASTIVNNTFSGSGLAVSGVSNGVFIIGNSFTSEAIWIGNSNGLVIGGSPYAYANIFNNISGDAIKLENSNGSAVVKNTINGATGTGIVIQGLDNQIESNQINTVTGWDIRVSGGHSNKVNLNNITGNTGTFNGILLENGLSYTVNNNYVNGGSIELDSINSSPFYGKVKVTNNTVYNDPLGFSGHGAISLTDVNGAYVFGNSANNNLGNGFALINSFNNTLIYNWSYSNGRVGIYQFNGQYNKFSKNWIYNNNADIYGGRTGISPNPNKAAPVITSIQRIGGYFVVSGNNTAANDTVEVFLSDAASSNSTLKQNANTFKESAKATGASWTVNIPLGAYTTAGGEVYFIATATDVNGSTSTFSKGKGVELNGPTSISTGYGYVYSTASIPSVTYSWWVAGDATITAGQGTANATITFGSSFTGGYVNVGFTDPVNGWTVYQLAVSKSAPKLGEYISENAALAFPNPFSSSTVVKLTEEQKAATLNLYNVNGELVYTSSGHSANESIELGQNLKPGVYTLHVISGYDKKVMKIVKAD